MPADKELLLSLTRNVLDLKAEKKKYNKDMNETIKDVEKQIKKVCEE